MTLDLELTDESVKTLVIMVCHSRGNCSKMNATSVSLKVGNFVLEPAMEDGL
ncbi:hypothetical protein [Neolewinella aurantiaca]|uniref:hypothetical protein n=1 Tax=Neolewinella aurantiaca TaxID=2602767 RepID=UPI00164F0A35|nr:hypothetical protein [Neolewinella aurantiaca]